MKGCSFAHACDEAGRTDSRGWHHAPNQRCSISKASAFIRARRSPGRHCPGRSWDAADIRVKYRTAYYWRDRRATSYSHAEGSTSGLAGSGQRSLVGSQQLWHAFAQEIDERADLRRDTDATRTAYRPSASATGSRAARAPARRSRFPGRAADIGSEPIPSPAQRGAERIGDVHLEIRQWQFERFASVGAIEMPTVARKKRDDLQARMLASRSLTVCGVPRAPSGMRVTRTARCPLRRAAATRGPESGNSVVLNCSDTS